MLDLGEVAANVVPVLHVEAAGFGEVEVRDDNDVDLNVSIHPTPNVVYCKVLAQSMQIISRHGRSHGAALQTLLPLID